MARKASRRFCGIAMNIKANEALAGSPDQEFCRSAIEAPQSLCDEAIDRRQDCQTVLAPYPTMSQARGSPRFSARAAGLPSTAS